MEIQLQMNCVNIQWRLPSRFRYCCVKDINTFFTEPLYRWFSFTYCLLVFITDVPRHSLESSALKNSRKDSSNSITSVKEPDIPEPKNDRSSLIKDKVTDLFGQSFKQSFSQCLTKPCSIHIQFRLTCYLNIYFVNSVRRAKS